MRRENTVVCEGLFGFFPPSCWVGWIRAKSTRPLHGLPILVKDAIGTDDKMETACKCSATRIQFESLGVFSLLMYVQLARMPLSVPKFLKIPLL